MKNSLFFVVLFTFIPFSQIQSQCGNLYIAGVIDGPLTLGTPKAIQFCASDDIVDLSIYGFGAANNGGGSDGEEFSFPEEPVSSGDCFWVATESIQFNNWFGFTPCYTSGFASINGDDAIELYCSGTVEDLFGDINVDGTGQCWEYLDGWAKNDLTAQNGGIFSCSDYTFSGVNALDGETSNATATTPYPAPGQICPGVVPVSISSFSVQSFRDNMVLLLWTTEAEVNNDFFEVQHSITGNEFSAISVLKGGGTTFTSQKYEFVHTFPNQGTNYYRIKQVDINGDFEIFDVKMIEINSNKLIWKLFPTVANRIINIQSTAKNIDEISNLIFYTIGGKRVKTIRIKLDMQNQIDISSFIKGSYILRIETEGNFQTLRFTII